MPKIKGFEKARFKRTRQFPVTVVDGDEEHEVFLTLSSLPFGFEREMEKELPLPIPPDKVVIDPKTRGVVRNPNGVPMKEPDTKDEKYVAEEERVAGLRYMWIILRALENDDMLIVETDRDKYTDPFEYYSAVQVEFLECGFPAGAIKELAEAALENSGFDIKRHIRNARRFF